MGLARRFVRASLGFAGGFAVMAGARIAAADSTIVLQGTVEPGGLDHFFLPFTVPPGTAEIQIEHQYDPSSNILDWGLNDENGYRGWGGGLTDTLVVNAQAATRCYVPGPMTPGTWNVVVGKANVIDPPVSYTVTITLRDAVTLPPQTDRSPYKPVPAIKTGRQWYAGDFHTHSTESGDAGDSIDTLVKFAESMGLDFVEISDHNSITQLDYFNGEQAAHPNILLVPGDEWTTYHGHGNGIGATQWVDHKVGQPGVTAESAIEAFNAQGAIFSINHPGIDLGTLCIGCLWTYYGLDPSQLGAIEVESRGYHSPNLGSLFAPSAVALWEDLTASGTHLAAIGGSDDHQGGQDAEINHVGTPTTYVLADELSVAGLLQGVRNKRTFVKLNSPSDPAIDFESSVEPVGDTVTAQSTAFRATVTGGADIGAQFRWVKNGVAGEFVDVTSDPFTAQMADTASADGPDRVRAEVFVNGEPSTLTSYLWLAYDATGPNGAAQTSSGGGCTASPGTADVAPFLFGLGAIAFFGMRRRRR